MDKTTDLKMVDNAYGMGQLSMFEWFDFKDRYSSPANQTASYYRTCLYPLLGKRSYHLGKIELWYAFECMKKSWTKAISDFRRCIEKREKVERRAEKTRDNRERFLNGR